MVSWILRGTSRQYGTVGFKGGTQPGPIFSGGTHIGEAASVIASQGSSIVNFRCKFFPMKKKFPFPKVHSASHLAFLSARLSTVRKKLSENKFRGPKTSHCNHSKLTHFHRDTRCRSHHLQIQIFVVGKSYL